MTRIYVTVYYYLHILKESVNSKILQEHKKLVGKSSELEIVGEELMGIQF